MGIYVAFRPPPSSGGGGERAGLLGSIQGFGKSALKKATTNDRSAPDM